MKISNNFDGMCCYLKENNRVKILKMQEQFTERRRYKEYKYFFLRAALEKDFRAGMKLILGKEDKQWKALGEYFEWSQCRNSSYNKYFVTLMENLCENLEMYKRAYYLLEDDISQKVFYFICMWRMTRRSSFLIRAYQLSWHGKQYWDPIVRLGNDEVFVDAGAYTGDTTREFIDRVDSYSKIYCYEPDIQNIERAKEYLQEYDNIIYRNAGVGSKKAQELFQNIGLSSSCFQKTESGGG